MKTLAAIVLSSLLLAGCVSPFLPAPPKAVPTGPQSTVADKALTRNTMATLSFFANVKAGTPINKWVTRQPSGKPGKRKWQEVWVVDPKGQNAAFVIDFKETGKTGAQFSIDTLKTDS